MICEKCGQWMEDGTTVCSKCGAVYQIGDDRKADGAPAQDTVNAAPVQNMANAAAPAMENPVQPGDAGQYVSYTAAPVGGMTEPVRQPGLTKKDFYKHSNMASVRKQITGAAIASYIVAAITLILASVLDAVLILGLGLGVHLARSRVCAILMTVYGVVNVIVVTMTTGTFGGWLILVAGIYAVIFTFKYQNAWEEYQKTGIVPDLSAQKAKK